jgi:hypothetical protein
MSLFAIHTHTEGRQDECENNVQLQLVIFWHKAYTENLLEDFELEHVQNLSWTQSGVHKYTLKREKHSVRQT